MTSIKTEVNSFDNPWDENDKKKDSKRQNFVLHDNDNSGSSNGKNQIPFNGNSKTIAIVVILLPLLAWLSTGFFIVEPDQEALIIRFGKYHSSASPGLSYKFPDPIDKAIKVSVTTINRELIGVRSQGLGKIDDSAKINVTEESQMLTGDENIIDMHFFVQWKIKDAYNYIFKTRENPISDTNTLRVSAESAIREVIGLVKLNEAISEQRQDIEKQAKIILQKMLDDYQTGIEVVNLGILYSYVPAEVKDAYRDIQAAKADKEREINQAYAYRNDILPKARGQVSAILEDAKGKKETIVSDAIGQANRFNSIQKEYQISPEITRKRIYIETMESVLSDKDKVLMSKGISGSTLPLLQLDKNK
jgi:membrane protease subunit HflK